MTKESRPSGDPHFPDPQDFKGHLYDMHGYEQGGDTVLNEGLRRRRELHALDSDPVLFHRKSHEPENAKLFGPARQHKHEA